jgi:farnesyl diphosphate synthase
VQIRYKLSTIPDAPTVTYSFPDELASTATDIEQALATLITAPALSGPGLPPDRLIAAMRHGSLNGGKRLRPLLVRQAAGVFGTASAATITAGLAVEMIHCYSLIHDDLPAMDDDDLRRGRPTVHKAYDDATAILAGDALLTHALALLADAATHPDPTIRVRLVTELAAGAGAGGMVGGQMRDIEGETSFLTERAIAQMQAMKTGALIRAAVRIGAILGGASDADLTHLTAYAEAAGRAFQLADDILDVTASAEALGKATGKDAEKGKQTIVARIGVEAAQRQLAEIIHDALTALLPFDHRADGLRATARFFAERSN